MLQGLSEPEFHCELVYKFRKMEGKPNFSDQICKIVIWNNERGITLMSLNSLLT